MTSFMQKKETVDRKWYVIDAKDQPLGKVAAKAAHMLRGKHKPTYTPHVDCGDYIIIINAKDVKLTGNKLDQKMYYNHSMYPGGLRERTARVMKEKYPIEMMERAVKGMLTITDTMMHCIWTRHILRENQKFQDMLMKAENSWQERWQALQ